MIIMYLSFMDCLEYLQKFEIYKPVLKCCRQRRPGKWIHLKNSTSQNLSNKREQISSRSVCSLYMCHKFVCIQSLIFISVSSSSAHGGTFAGRKGEGLPATRGRCRLPPGFLPP